MGVFTLSITIRKADLERDESLLVGFMAENLNLRITPQRYRWLYLNCPYGLANAWIAEQQGEIVGTAAAFPRRMLKPEGQTGWVLGDFCISARHRSLGPAVMLQKALLAALPQPPAIWFDFPHSNMLPVYKRLGLESNFRLIRWARPLRMDAKVRQLSNNPLVYNVLTAAMNSVLKVHGSILPRNREVEIRIGPAAFDEEFSRLASAAAAACGNSVLRTPDYLTWRYGLHPERRYQLATARLRGSMVGFCVFECADLAILADELFASDVGVTGAIMAELAGKSREWQANSISVPVAEGSSVATCLQQVGFKPRESAPVLVSPWNAAARDWFLTNGDRES